MTKSKVVAVIAPGTLIRRRRMTLVEALAKIEKAFHRPRSGDKIEPVFLTKDECRVVSAVLRDELGIDPPRSILEDVVSR